MLLTVLVVLLALMLLGGGWGHRRYGYASWSPLSVLALIILVLILTDNIRL